MENIFDKQGVQNLINRINQLQADTQPQWGKMNAPQMLAHLNVAYEMTYEDIHPKPNFFMRFMLKTFVKKAVCGPKPYAKNTRTAPQFVTTGTSKDFEKEKKRLIDYMTKTQQLGATHFNNKESHSFGPLTTEEWNRMFAKHIEHHLTQFGV